MKTLREEVLEVLASQEGDFYTRDITDPILGLRSDLGDLRQLVVPVRKVLTSLEEAGVLSSRIVYPGPDTFQGGMCRRYYSKLIDGDKPC